MNIPKIKMPDQRSKRFIFIPFCLICQAFQAQGIVRYGYSATIKPIVEEILRYNINIIQMPCPESQFGGYTTGLKREPKGIDRYDVPEFREICKNSASEVVSIIRGVLANDYKVVTILGIEYSPSCAIRLQYSRRGTFHQPGLFIESLQNQLDEEKIEIPFIGINRRGINKSLSELRDLLIKQKDLLDF